MTVIKFHKIYSLITSFLISFLGIYAEAQSITISTSPFLPDDVVASNYVGLQIISLITSSSSPLVCTWVTTNFYDNFYEIDGCVSVESNDEFSAVCNVTENSIIFNYTTHAPLLTDLTFQVYCLFPQEVAASINIQVQGTRCCFAVVL